jgi:hypothetical protein
VKEDDAPTGPADYRVRVGVPFNAWETAPEEWFTGLAERIKRRSPVTVREVLIDTLSLAMTWADGVPRFEVTVLLRAYGVTSAAITGAGTVLDALPTDFAYERTHVTLRVIPVGEHGAALTVSSQED